MTGGEEAHKAAAVAYINTPTFSPDCAQHLLTCNSLLSAGSAAEPEHSY